MSEIKGIAIQYKIAAKSITAVHINHQEQEKAMQQSGLTLEEGDFITDIYCKEYISFIN